ncbi:MAG: ABC transporter permease [Nitrospinota bacterium]
MTFFIDQTFNGVSYGALLFLLASGLSLIFGVMRIINIAHGAYYLLGGYIGFSVMVRTQNLAAAIVGAALAIAVIGILMERIFLRRLHGNELGQVLLTMGFALVFQDLDLIIWGGDPLTVPVPKVLSASLRVGDQVFPVYRLFIIAISVLVGIFLWLFQSKTRYGAMVRAAVDDQEMARGVGINVPALSMAVFALGAFLAAVGGVVAGGWLGVEPGNDFEILPYAFVVVIVGGLGSLEGAMVGSLVVGLVDNFGKALFPEFSYFTLYVPMAVILATRPSGLFGRTSGGAGVGRVFRIGIGIATLAILLVAPPFLSEFLLALLTKALIFAVLAMSLNILLGYTGLPSLGHAAFLGIAAYTVAVMTTRHGAHFWSTLVVGLGLTLAVAAVFGLLAIRAKGVYFLMITLALGESIWGLAYRWNSMTGGDNGITGIPRPDFGLPISVEGETAFYYFTVLVFLMALLFFYLLVRSPFGHSLIGIRESESRMRMLGYNTWLHKYIAYVLAGGMGGVAGILWAYYNAFVSPEDVVLVVSVETLLMVALGGAGTLLGPALGAGILVFLREYVSTFAELELGWFVLDFKYRWVSVMGLIYILTVLYAPDGLLGAAQRWARRRAEGLAEPSSER